MTVEFFFMINLHEKVWDRAGIDFVTLQAWICSRTPTDYTKWPGSLTLCVQTEKGVLSLMHILF